MKNWAVSLAVSLVLVVGAANAEESTLDPQLAAAGKNAAEIRGFLDGAKKAHGAFGEKAARFLVEGMPARDLKTLKRDFLLENLALALKARTSFPWAKELPEAVFFNDVLPYASLDETREAWRKEFHEQCAELVKSSKTSSEAAQVINKDFFNLINVHYNTGRKAPNQSPSESKALGMATCTGLSIILVDACRSVGVPARVAGTPLWSNKRGNHTWVEIYDQGDWFFTGADEYNKGGLNRAWFAGDASKAIADNWKHAIWATSWQKADAHFPMVWNLEDKSVPGVNVTARYAKAEKDKAAETTVYLRAWDKRGGKRLTLHIDVLDTAGKTLHSVETRAGTADLNDMASVKLLPGASYRLRVVNGKEERSLTLKVEGADTVTQEVIWGELGKERVGSTLVRDWLALLPEERHLSVPQAALTKEDADAAAQLIFETLRKEGASTRQAELEARVVKAADKEMRYLEKTFGKAKDGERSLFISLHGGGGAPARINDQQWRNQIRLYAPKEGLVVAPRAPTNTWNLWHEGHIDDLLDRLIENFVLQRGVNPNRVYLMGYSAGGDGVYQLGPRMADRFAAASMMAGHPNDANPLGLRNLPFMIFVGANDAAYKRNQVAAEWGEKLAKLRKDDPKGYEHKVTIYPGFGHWMNGKDVEALPWMADRTRNPWPKKIVWHQSSRTHERFYWLSVPKGAAQRAKTVRASVKGQRLEIEAEGVEALTLRLSDALLDLDKPVIVVVNGKQQFKGKVPRSVQAIWSSLRERLDLQSAAVAELELKP